MGIVDFQLIPYRSDRVYTPGQIITGEVKLILDKSKKIKRIKLKFKGLGRVRWTETTTVRNVSNGKDERKTEIYSSEEKYVNHKIILNQRNEETYTLAAGKHSFPFEIQIPKNIPSSFQHHIGKIFYFIQTKIVIPNQCNRIKTEILTIRNFINLNDYPNLQVPTAAEKIKKLYHLCCIPGGRLLISVRIPKSAFVLGENIPISLDINNHSNTRIRQINAHLWRTIDFTTTKKTNHTRTLLQSYVLSQEILNGHSSYKWTKNITVSQENCPYLENCHIIIMKYLLQIEAKTEGLHCDSDLLIPITIGHISYNSEATNENMNYFLVPITYEEDDLFKSEFSSIFKNPDELVPRTTSSSEEEKK